MRKPAFARFGVRRRFRRPAPRCGFRECLVDCSKGDGLRLFWALFRLRERVRSRPVRSVMSFVLNRLARRHGGYVGGGAYFAEIPSLPHGLHGVYISRYAGIGAGCRIYQNVTIGEVGGAAPQIGDRCLIGAGAVLVGDIRIGNDVKIGAGAVVCSHIPDGCTVVAQPPRVIAGGRSGHGGHSGAPDRTGLD